jgi:alpha-tubulin suppressor-like RCC1 family protein
LRWLAPLVLACGCVEPLDVFSALPPDAGQAFIAEGLTAASDHACAVHAGALFCWGGNADGQLGLGDVQPRPQPVRVGTASDWAEVSAGYGSTCARKTNGEVYCWGDNTHGQLGSSVSGGLRVPAQVALGFVATSLALHFQHVCVTSQSDELWCWGMNTEGQLGLNEPTYPTFDVFSPQHVAPGTAWKQVDTGQGHTCAIQMDGSLWCWGRNSQGHLGLAATADQQIHVPQHVGTDTDWAHAYATQQGSCALKTNGTLWCWGYLYDAPIESYTIQYGPEQLGTQTWTQVQMETFDLCARSADGHLWCQGRGDEGELGAGDTMSRYTPFDADGAQWVTGAMGRMFRCATKSDGRVFCTGENADGELGTGDSMRHDVMTEVHLP